MMNPSSSFLVAVLVVTSIAGNPSVNAFVPARTPIRYSECLSSSSSAVTEEKVDASTGTSGKGFSKEAPKKKISAARAKEQLLDLIPRMTGSDNEEFRQVESLVNTLEETYVPVQTLGFLNLAMQGDWQLLFSTNLSGTPNPRKFRLRELIQIVKCNKLEGSVVNQATWDLAEDGDANFEATGTFSVKCKYEINQGARMIMDLEDHVLEPARGSVIPKDVPALVGLLHRSMPKELFDPAEHAIDTTYLDADLRIVRYTGPRLEGVRDIFIRKGAIEINPTETKE